MGGVVTAGAAGGVAYRYSPASSTYQIIWNFCTEPGGTSACTDGANPTTPLTVDATNGDLYGGTGNGGGSPSNRGTIFQLSPSGSSYGLTPLYTFCCAGVPNAPKGDTPNSALLLESSGIYGTTIQGGYYPAMGGNSGWGTVFKLNGGAVTNPHRFCFSDSPCATDGNYPTYGLPLIRIGTKLYGETTNGGPNGFGEVYSISTGALGTFTVVHGFAGTTTTDGAYPQGGLVGPDTSGHLFGVTSNGGANGGSLGYGTVFEITP